MTGNFRNYGAFELKRSYQRNVCLAMLISLSLHLCVTLYLFLFSPKTDQYESEKIIRIRTIAQLMAPPPPPSVGDQAGRMEKITEGMLKPSSDSRETQISTKRVYYGEIFGFVYDVSAEGAAAGGDGTGYVQIGVPSKNLLSQIKLVETDRLPECIRSVLPHYPDSAKQNGIEGEVWLQVLVDKNGRVAQVNIFKKSKTDVGFERAALDAAQQWEYRPALSDNKPVAVWIVYTLKFKLKLTFSGKVLRQRYQLTKDTIGQDQHVNVYKFEVYFEKVLVSQTSHRKGENNKTMEVIDA